MNERMKATLHQIMKYAVSDELIRKNPCESVDIVIPSNKVNPVVRAFLSKHKEKPRNI